MSARVLSWAQLDGAQRRSAVAALNERATIRVEAGGSVMPWGWADRLAPMLRYTFKRGTVWDIIAPGAQSIFSLPLPASIPFADIERPALRAA